VRFAADLASREPARRIAATPETTDYTDLHI